MQERQAPEQASTGGALSHLPHELQQAAAQHLAEKPSAWDSDDDSDASDTSATMSQPAAASAGAAAKPRQGSIASTYWRPERKDRTDQLSMIDER